MECYVVMCEDLTLDTNKVSQEGYRTLEEAQQFCKERTMEPEGGQYELNDSWVWGNWATSYRYVITLVRVK